MFVFAFEGNLGQGKTSAMSIFAHWYRKQAMRRGLEVTLFANYDLAESKPLKSYETFYEVAECESSICVVDEAHTSFDSRMFSKGYAVYFTQFVMYFRKLRTCLFVATPTIENIDTRIRQLTSILVHCTKLKNGFKYHIFDYQSMKLISTKFLPMQNATNVFAAGLYNTEQMVRSITFPGTDKEYDQFLTKIIQISDQRKLQSERGLECPPNVAVEALAPTGLLIGGVSTI